MNRPNKVLRFGKNCVTMRMDCDKMAQMDAAAAWRKHGESRCFTFGMVIAKNNLKSHDHVMKGEHTI